MARVLHTNDDAVTTGVVNHASFKFEPDLREVTFLDHRDSVHTVRAHKDGPFTTTEEIIAAFDAGTLHTFEADEQAISYYRQQGDNTTADRIEARVQRDTDAETKTGGGS